MVASYFKYVRRSIVNNYCYLDQVRNRKLALRKLSQGLVQLEAATQKIKQKKMTGSMLQLRNIRNICPLHCTYEQITKCNLIQNGNQGGCATSLPRRKKTTVLSITHWELSVFCHIAQDQYTLIFWKQENFLRLYIGSKLNNVSYQHCLLSLRYCININ